MGKLNNQIFNLVARAGLAANLPSSTLYLQEGEFAYTTDGKILYITDGSNNKLAVMGIVPYVSKSGSYALTIANYVVVFTATATATLPASMPVGKTFRIKNKSGAGGIITVTPASGLIDDAANAVLAVNNEAIDIVFDGTNWQVF